MYDQKLPLFLKKPPPCFCPYFYWIQLKARDHLAVWLREREIYTTFRYYPLHKVRRYGSTTKLTKAESAAEKTLCLPLHPSLSDDDVNFVIDCIWKFQ